jgi:ABC-type branched-subunit amino acid transport system substrate-binding protein
MSAFVVLLAALASVAGAPTELRLGGLFPVFTSAPPYNGDSSGNQRQAAFLMAVKEINANPSILPNTVIKVFVRDSKRSEQKALYGAMRLVRDDKVDAIVGCASSGPSMVAARIANENQVPMVSYSSTRHALSSK